MSHLNQAALVLCCLAFNFGAEALIGRNYWLGTVCVTPMALLITEFGHFQITGELALDRVVDTLVGAAVGILAAVLVTNRRATSLIGDALAATARAQTEADAALAAPDADPVTLEGAPPPHRRPGRVAERGRRGLRRMVAARPAPAGGPARRTGRAPYARSDSTTAGAPRPEGCEHMNTGTAARRRDGDTVAGVIRQWQSVHPGLDTAPMEIIGRVNRCAALLQQAEDAPLRRAGLSRAEFDLLGALRRTGDELTPGELARETFSSGAAVTKRVKQLQERELVERRADTRDRRVARVRLTDAGRALVDGILPEQLAYEKAVLAGLDEDGHEELTGLLSGLLLQLEGRLGGL
ncbi:MarR family transcriptional regulator [Actinomadura keratinilytica]